MARTLRTRRLAVLTASAALAAGGALIPTAAFAAPAQTSAVATQAPQQEAKTVSGYANDVDVTSSSSDSSSSSSSQSTSYVDTPDYSSYSTSSNWSSSQSSSYSQTWVYS
ncbi:hypothetical protein [Streptomyces sp. 6-11-2]|uniref:hypothetical protein n=1 Tax=Streptomyces sp. 6-11-2 TaxID=2585753 RepID=UPI00114235BF|nr:hypothetical protein [Streptomyces sp. 6-11-2]GED90119.1 hypothetical protein TNCT6_72040 [Streptomyces sp. 6-11-2]